MTKLNLENEKRKSPKPYRLKRFTGDPPAIRTPDTLLKSDSFAICNRCNCRLFSDCNTLDPDIDPETPQTPHRPLNFLYSIA
jgi:hypothetical protein